jgi:hypothetical protein
MHATRPRAKKRPLPEHLIERQAEIRRRSREGGDRRRELDRQILAENLATSRNLDLIGG